MASRRAWRAAVSAEALWSRSAHAAPSPRATAKALSRSCVFSCEAVGAAGLELPRQCPRPTPVTNATTATVTSWARGDMVASLYVGAGERGDDAHRWRGLGPGGQTGKQEASEEHLKRRGSGKPTADDILDAVGGRTPMEYNAETRCGPAAYAKNCLPGRGKLRRQAIARSDGRPLRRTP